MTFHQSISNSHSNQSFSHQYFIENTACEFNKIPHRQDSPDELPFGIRAASALGISVIADRLDYVGAPIFALPIVGDIADLVVSGLLYRITKSKINIAINAVEFIPFIGDFIPTYKISTTLLGILNESRKRHDRQGNESKAGADKDWRTPPDKSREGLRHFEKQVGH